MAINESELTKGQIRKLGALRRSIGDQLAEEAFAKWLRQQKTAEKKQPTDHTAEAIAEMVRPLDKRKDINLGRYGYTIKRARGKGAKGIIVVRNEKP